jgi:hypothetical protein
MQNFLGKNLHVIINHVYSIQKHTKTLFSFPNKEKHLQFVIFFSTSTLFDDRIQNQRKNSSYLESAQKSIMLKNGGRLGVPPEIAPFILPLQKLINSRGRVGRCPYKLALQML